MGTRIEAAFSVPYMRWLAGHSTDWHTVKSLPSGQRGLQAGYRVSGCSRPDQACKWLLVALMVALGPGRWIPL